MRAAAAVSGVAPGSVRAASRFTARSADLSQATRGTKARTLKLKFMRGAPRVVRGSYVTAVTARIGAERVARVRSLKLR